jgi:hypothetical protein
VAGTGRIRFYSSDLHEQGLDSALFGGSAYASGVDYMRVLYSFALFDPTSGTQYSNGSSGFPGLVKQLGGARTLSSRMTVDNCGNVRIPSLDKLSGYDPEQPFEWVDVRWRESIQNYSSLIGTPFRGVAVESVENTSFVLETSYHVFKVGPRSYLQNTRTCPNANDNL